MLTVSLAGLPPGVTVRVVDAEAVVPADPGNRRRKPTPSLPPFLVLEVDGIPVQAGDSMDDPNDPGTCMWTPDAKKRLDALIPPWGQWIGPGPAVVALSDSLDPGRFDGNAGTGKVRIWVAIPEAVGIVATEDSGCGGLDGDPGDGLDPLSIVDDAVQREAERVARGGPRTDCRSPTSAVPATDEPRQPTHSTQPKHQQDAEMTTEEKPRYYASRFEHHDQDGVSVPGFVIRDRDDYRLDGTDGVADQDDDGDWIYGPGTRRREASARKAVLARVAQMNAE